MNNQAPPPKQILLMFVVQTDQSQGLVQVNMRCKHEIKSLNLSANRELLPVQCVTYRYAAGNYGNLHVLQHLNMKLRPDF